MKKLESEVNRLNEDLEFVQLMTDEEENEALRKTYINQGYEHGIEQGEKSGKLKEKREIAKEMLNNKIPIEVIIKCTGLKEEEINELS